MDKKTFVNIWKIFEETQNRADEFNKDLENAFNKGFREGDLPDDTSVYCYWYLDPIRKIIENILISMGESSEGAEWAIYELTYQLKYGPSSIDDYEISSYEDYYDYLTGNFENLKKVNCD